MEQRRLRLGDILDDYCPRERRLTNHAVVAMIEEDVKQTRCTTCEAEHVYKGGKVPRRKKKDDPGALYKEVLAGMPDDAPPVLAATPPAEATDAQPRSPMPVALPPLAPIPPAHYLAPDAARGARTPEAAAPAAAALDQDTADTDADAEPHPEAPPVEEGPVHRRLIRAQLPRIEGHKEERRLPEFTIRQQPGRGAQGFRGDGRPKPHGGSAGNGNGNNQRGHGAHRFTAARPGAPARGPHGRGGGPAPGFRSAGQPRQGGSGGPRKRSR